MSRRLATAGRSINMDIDRLDSFSEVTLGLASTFCITSFFLLMALPFFGWPMMPWINDWEGPPGNTTTTEYVVRATTMAPLEVVTTSSEEVVTTVTTTTTTETQSTDIIEMFDFKEKLACHYQGTVSFKITIDNVDLTQAELQDIVSFKGKLQEGLASAAGHGCIKENIILSSFRPEEGRVQASTMIVVPNGGLKVSAAQLRNYFSLGHKSKSARVETNNAIVRELLDADNIKNHTSGVVSCSWGTVDVEDAFGQMDNMHFAALDTEEEDTLKCQDSWPKGCEFDWSDYMKHHCCNFQGLCCKGYEPPEAVEVEGGDEKLSRSEFSAGLAILQPKCQLTPEQEEYAWKGLSPSPDGFVSRKAWSYTADVCRKFYCELPQEIEDETSTTESAAEEEEEEMEKTSTEAPMSPPEKVTTPVGMLPPEKPTKPTGTTAMPISTYEPIPKSEWDPHAGEICRIKIDLTGDGVIDPDEFNAVVAKSLDIRRHALGNGFGDAPATASGDSRIVFKDMDTNGDGQISLDECTERLTRYRQETKGKGKFTMGELASMEREIIKNHLTSRRLEEVMV